MAITDNTVCGAPKKKDPYYGRYRQEGENINLKIIIWQTLSLHIEFRIENNEPNIAKDVRIEEREHVHHNSVQQEPSSAPQPKSGEQFIA